MQLKHFVASDLCVLGDAERIVQVSTANSKRDCLGLILLHVRKLVGFTFNKSFWTLSTDVPGSASPASDVKADPYACCCSSGLRSCVMMRIKAANMHLALPCWLLGDMSLSFHEYSLIAHRLPYIANMS